VGSLRRAGSAAEVEDVVQALAEEAKARYEAVPVPLDGGMLELARAGREEFLVRLPA
jgi:dihydroxyacetone kinase-like predicted kinase